MEVRIIKKPLTKRELKEIAEKQFGNLVKAVVDIEKGILAIAGEMHADEEIALMREEESKRENTWGINIYPDKKEEEFIEFDSIVNLKPSFGNRSRNIENPEIKEKIKEIVANLIK